MTLKPGLGVIQGHWKLHSLMVGMTSCLCLINSNCGFILNSF